MFDAYEISLELLRTLRPRLKRLRSCDASLSKQLTRAAASVPLNLSEGRQRVGGDRVQAGDVIASMALVNRLQAMCWRLTH